MNYKSLMNPYQAKHALRDLSETCVDNLRCGRITNEAVMRAAQRVAIDRYDTYGIGLGYSGNIPGDADMFMADELNDMLEAATVLDSEGAGNESV